MEYACSPPVFFFFRSARYPLKRVFWRALALCSLLSAVGFSGRLSFLRVLFKNSFELSALCFCLSYGPSGHLFGVPGVVRTLVGGRRFRPPLEGFFPSLSGVHVDPPSETRLR